MSFRFHYSEASPVTDGCKILLAFQLLKSRAGFRRNQTQGEPQGRTKAAGNLTPGAPSKFLPSIFLLANNSGSPSVDRTLREGRLPAAWARGCEGRLASSFGSGAAANPVPGCAAPAGDSVPGCGKERRLGGGILPVSPSEKGAEVLYRTEGLNPAS